MKDPTQVHLLTVLIIDHDKLGAKECASVLEHTRYSNDCIGPYPINTRTVTVDWSDDHPLNRGDTIQAELARLFPNAPAVDESTAREQTLVQERDRYQRRTLKAEEDLARVNVALNTGSAEISRLTVELECVKRNFEELSLLHAQVTRDRDDAKAQLASTDRALGECDTERCEALTLLDAARKLAKQREAGESDAREHAALLVKEVAAERDAKHAEGARAALAERNLADFMRQIYEAIGGTGCEAPEVLIQRIRSLVAAPIYVSDRGPTMTADNITEAEILTWRSNRAALGDDSSVTLACAALGDPHAIRSTQCTPAVARSRIAAILSTKGP